MQGMTVIVISL